MRTKKPLNVYIDPDLRDQLKAWIADQGPLAPTETAVVEVALREFLASRTKKKPGNIKAA